ncbi:MFS transporter [uncultured Aurantimicrobium sp.]|uniref:MFS transporter n=1 Tax=uncultured Aurantimicrobium sp. TaxID=1705357 RepID=UPI00262D80CA|nr:MFS transporter [uncultured Aurantimicrobium sp.]
MSRKKLSPRSWYWLAFASFGVQGLYFSTWVSRTPEIQKLLGLDTAQMGLFTLAMAVGSLSGLLIGGPIIARFGTRIVLIFAYCGGAVFLALLGVVSQMSNLPLATLAIVFVGFSGGAGGLAINIEGANVDRNSPKSLLPSLHGAFSLGSLLGGAIGTVAIVSGVSVEANLIGMSVLVFIVTLLVTTRLPRTSGMHVHAEMNTDQIATVASAKDRRRVWLEPQTLMVAFIVIGFNLAEGTASTWLPIALVDAGLSSAIATASYTVFAGAMAVGRLSGGPIVDYLGRARALIVFAAITALGILIVILTGWIALPLVGAALWGLGNSIGFPLCVSAVSEDPRLAGSRVGVLVVASNTSGIAGPPLLGFIGQVAGLFTAFLVPFFLLMAGMAFNRATRTHSTVDARR